MVTPNKELKRLRMSLNLTQKQLAESINVSPARYSSWERGEKTPSTAHLQALASKLTCSISKLVVQQEEPVAKAIYCSDRSPSFIYFNEDNASDRIHTSLSDELIIKLSIFELPIKFELSEYSKQKLLTQIIDDDSNFIKIETIDDKLFFVNRSNIQWTIFHDEAADEYPALAGEGFHETPLLKADVDKKTVLFMMAKNGNFEISEDSDYYLSNDLEWMIKNKSKLADEIPTVITSLKTSLKESYSSLLNNSEKSNYEQNFTDAWGVRVYLKSGEQIFLPGIFDRGEGWDDCVQHIKPVTKFDENTVTVFFDHERLNTYCIPIKDISFIEYPSVFEALGLYAEYVAFERKEELDDFEEIDAIINKLYNLAWNDEIQK